MPLLPATYTSPSRFLTSDIQTIYPALFRKVTPPPYTRERIETPDGDFIDLDLLKNGSKSCVVLSHGLEGSSNSRYIQAIANHLAQQGFDVVAWNMRGCSGEPNRLVNSYHSGKSEDLRHVVKTLLEKRDYEKIYLIGFSVGGNITLKYLGEEGAAIDPRVKAAVCYSVPVDLADSAERLGKIRNLLYMRWFLTLLKGKIAAKAKMFPHEVALDRFWRIKNFYDFDTRYTAPMNGFTSAEEYWKAASSVNMLSEIRIPTLLASARDDSFLGERCFPIELAQKSKYLSLEMPNRGGHVGFIPHSGVSAYWTEVRAVRFFEGKT